MDSSPFRTWLSITSLLVLIFLFRSIAGPFLNPRGAPRQEFSSSTFYWNISAFLYCWLLLVTTLTILPHFSAHYNEITAMAMFFPMTFATICAVLFGRLMTRMGYYICTQWKMAKPVVQQSLTIVQSFAKLPTSPEKLSPPTQNDPFESATVPLEVATVPLIAFHRPFRRLLRSSVILSGCLSFLYAHCWNRSLKGFELDGPICNAFFFWSSHSNQATPVVAEENLWFIWITAVILTLISYTQEEFAGHHFRSRQRDHYSTHEGIHYNGVDDVEDLSSVDSTSESDHDSEVDALLSPSKINFFHKKDTEQPADTLPMVPWFSIMLVASVFDILVQLKVFLGRYDARTLQPVLNQNTTSKKNRQKKSVNNKDSAPDDIIDPEEHFSGCFFDYRHKKKNNKTDDGFWFDFVADTGDGFNSSYQVARLLADPNLLVHDKNNARCLLPRGSFLLIGGDLAYPEPNAHSYEKRFFRTFEDAMQPPPVFRRAAISTSKPALDNIGWRGCFQEDEAVDEEEDLLQSYKGPCTYIVPGNHDWYDGLATFTRYILYRDWLGGWLMPQQRSYFCIALPHGWWIFGCDIGLSSDIDIEQFKFFAEVASTMMKPTDAVVIITHEPSWVIDADLQRGPDELTEPNLRELMNVHLAGQVKARLAGDLHHYTRHVAIPKSLKRDQSKAVPSKKKRSKRSRSLPRKNYRSANCISKLEGDSSPSNDSAPQLIVSGGGGAFLIKHNFQHGTSTFEKYIDVGTAQQQYVRVCSYPSEKISYSLGWLNILHFRWRNWRADIVWAVGYFGIVSSLFPLCGIYDDYQRYNPSNSPVKFISWFFFNILFLLKEIFLSGRVSLFFTIVIMSILFFVTDSKMKPSTRFLVGSIHGLVHVFSAIGCLLFLECITEWTIEEHIVKVTSKHKLKFGSNDFEGIDLASSLYQEYTEHFTQVFNNITTTINASAVLTLKSDIIGDTTAVEELFDKSFRITTSAVKWLFFKSSLLRNTMTLFDLPGHIAQKHTDMCKILCKKGKECMIHSDPILFQKIERTTLFIYLAAISLYFVVLAIPCAGNVFGTWLAVTLNIFRAQFNEGFSSLRIEHWKNFLRLHIKEDTGDLEIFSVGIDRVPTQWKKDPKWDGSRDARKSRASLHVHDDHPSWSWERPSVWIPQRNHKKFIPRIVDYCSISKRSSSKAAQTPPSRGRETSSDKKRHTRKMSF